LPIVRVVTRSSRPPAPVDVVGVGVHALDLIGLIDGYPEPDTKAPLVEFDLQGGGVTATALVACTRLGLRTRYVGKVGSDFWARAALRTMAGEGVDVRHVIRVPGSAGHVSLVLVDRRSGARTLFFRRPPGYAMAPEQLDRAAVVTGRLLHVDGIDPEAAIRAIEWAREAGMRVTMDGERIVPGIDRVWPRVDVLVANPRFVAAVTGREAVEEGLRALAAAGPGRVGVTLGSEGAVGLVDGAVVRVGGLPVPVVDTNGAGDVFHGAVAFGELRGWPFEWVLTFANAVAALKCRVLGGRRGIPRLAEVAETLVAQGRGEIAAAL
jgi:sugar/nucleoside kinase (ribokinase family)